MNKIFLPLSIIIAGLIIAGAVFFTRGEQATAPTVADNGNNTPEFTVKPVSDDDHILGNPDAEIIVVEYSDFECPYCSRFHPTMEQVMDEYGSDGNVAWVYRHMPLDQIHKEARGASEASECVANIGGNSAFWDYSKKVFENQASASQTGGTAIDAAGLKSVALELGIDEGQYDSCIAENTYASKVESDYQDGLLIARADPQFGTPYSILITKSGEQFPIRGAQPYSVVKQLIDAILAEN